MQRCSRPAHSCSRCSTKSTKSSSARNIWPSGSSLDSWPTAMSCSKASLDWPRRSPSNHSPPASTLNSHDCNSRRTCCPPMSSARRFTIRSPARSPRGAAPSSPISCSPTKSIARLPRSKAHCSKRCRKSRSPSAIRRSNLKNRSSCSPRRIRSSRKGLTRCLKRKWIVSC